MFDDDDDDHIFSLLSAAVEVFDTPVPNFRNRKKSTVFMEYYLQGNIFILLFLYFGTTKINSSSRGCFSYDIFYFL